MHVSGSNWQDPNVRVYPVSPLVWFSGFFFLIACGLALAFFGNIRDFFQGLGKPAAPSIRGEWVGVLDLPKIRVDWEKPYGKRAVIRFNLSKEEHFLNKYGGTGEITIEGQQPQPIEVTHLWLNDTPPQRFECGIWKVPYNQNDKTDYLSGGFEGVFESGKLQLTRQTDIGYDMTGTLHKGTDQEYHQLVQQMQTHPSSDGGSR